MIIPSSNDSHWSDSAKALLQALILMVLLLRENERNLVTVRSLIMLTDRTVADEAKDYGGDKEKETDGVGNRSFRRFDCWHWLRLPEHGR